VRQDVYVGQLARFRSAYGSIRPWHVRVSLHPDGAPKQGDPRPFAFVQIVWQDDRTGFHMFQDRWVVDGGTWYTRVVGLIPNPPSG
jgi:hypothetical protein